MHFDHKKVKTTLRKIQILEKKDAWENTRKNTGKSEIAIDNKKYIKPKLAYQEEN